VGVYNGNNRPLGLTDSEWANYYAIRKQLVTIFWLLVGILGLQFLVLVAVLVT
jgi:hypothetical protein